MINNGDVAKTFLNMAVQGIGLYRVSPEKAARTLVSFSGHSAVRPGAHVCHSICRASFTVTHELYNQSLTETIAWSFFKTQYKCPSHATLGIVSSVI